MSNIIICGCTLEEVIQSLVVSMSTATFDMVVRQDYVLLDALKRVSKPAFHPLAF